MARDHARIHLDIWGDDDWRDLSPEAQHLYFVLYTWPPTLCGAGDWQPRKIQARARGWSVPKVLDAAEELVAGEFLLIDLDTEEHLLRSWIKHDGLYRIQNMAISITNARTNLASRQLRGVVVHEVLKLRTSEPKLDSWTKDQVVAMLAQKAIDPSDVDWASPWDSDSVSRSDRGKVSPKDVGEASPSVSSSPTPLLPTPSPDSKLQQSAAPNGTAKRGTRLPEAWRPNDQTIAEMRSRFPALDLKVEHEKFTNHWTDKTGKDATKLSWEGTWRNWIINAAQRQPARAPNGKPVSKLRDYAELEREARAAETQNPEMKELA